MEKPDKITRFLVQSWPYNMWDCVWVLAGEIWIIQATEFTPTTWRDWNSIFWLAGTTVIALPFVYVTAKLLSIFVFGPLHLWLGVRNGSPFGPGDWVQVLSGPHKGCVTRVYSKWQHEMVRVELGEREAEEFKDIFSPAYLWRTTKPLDLPEERPN